MISGTKCLGSSPLTTYTFRFLMLRTYNVHLLFPPTPFLLSKVRTYCSSYPYGQSLECPDLFFHLPLLNSRGGTSRIQWSPRRSTITVISLQWTSSLQPRPLSKLDRRSFTSNFIVFVCLTKTGHIRWGVLKSKSRGAY